MKKLILIMSVIILAMILLPALSEEVIAKYKDTFLTTEKIKGAAWHKAFYIFNPEKYRGKKIVFRMNMKRIEGNAPLSVGQFQRRRLHSGGCRIRQWRY